MLMQNIRRATKKHRKVLIAVVVLLAVGLVSSFAVWNSDKNYSSTDFESLTAAEKVQYYEKYLAENEPASVTDTDYSKAATMGSTYMELYDLCISAFYELYYDEATQEQAAQYSARASVAAGKAAEYYQQALSLAPAEMNDVALGQLNASIATALHSSGDSEQAGVYFEQADALAPNDLNVVYPYANYIYTTQGFAAAETYLNAFMAGLSEDDSAYSTAQSQLQLFQMYESFSSNNQEDGADTDAAGDDANADGDAAAE